MEYLDWILMVLLGVFSGAYGVLVGAGGGFILSPMLLLLFDTEEPEMVAGTVLAAIAINSVLVAVRYIRMRGCGLPQRGPLRGRRRLLGPSLARSA